MTLTAISAFFIAAIPPGPWIFDPTIFEVKSESNLIITIFKFPPPVSARFGSPPSDRFSAYHTVTLPGTKGSPVPGFFEWDPSLNALGVVPALINDKRVLPVVRTFVAFPIFSDTYFPLVLPVSTETILGQ